MLFSDVVGRGLHGWLLMLTNSVGQYSRVLCKISFILAQSAYCLFVCAVLCDYIYFAISLFILVSMDGFFFITIHFLSGCTSCSGLVSWQQHKRSSAVEQCSSAASGFWNGELYLSSRSHLSWTIDTRTAHAWLVWKQDWNTRSGKINLGLLVMCELKSILFPEVWFLSFFFLEWYRKTSHHFS